MPNKSRNIAIIPARGGSKGLPRKNILPFRGKPLIVWTIEQALACKQIDQVLVSTDSPEIAKISRDHGATIQELRPTALSSDTTSTEEVLIHIGNKLQNTISSPVNIILLQCTSPIRMPETLDQAIHQYEEEKADSLVSVSKTHRFFWYNKSKPHATYDHLNRPRRQDIAPANVPYIETGSIYITKLNMLMKHQNRLCGKITMFETDYFESFEIDDQEDFELCEYLHKKVIFNEN